jgi:methionyl-tRNA formyltransferase
MRVIFLGTPEFAVPSLKALIASPYEVCAAVTQPDRPAGRGRRLHPPAVKILAEAERIPILQPEKIRDPRNRPALEVFRPDFVVVVAFGQILPKWLLDLPSLGPVNVHASLLPLYRGAAPISHAIMNGDTRSGVTTMLMDETLDTGPILLQRAFAVSEDMTAGDLSDLLSRAGAELLIATLDGLRTGTIQPAAQDHSRATLAPRIAKETACVSWQDPARRIHNLVRGMNPWPLAYTVFREQRLQLIRSRVAREGGPAGPPAGTYLESTPDGILVQCGGGSMLELVEVQLAGKSRTSGRAFANGARLQPRELIFTRAEAALE